MAAGVGLAVQLELGLEVAGEASEEFLYAGGSELPCLVCSRCEEVTCSGCGAVMPFDETVGGACAECWFGDQFSHVRVSADKHVGCSTVSKAASPTDSACVSRQVADWVLPFDEIGFGSLVFPRIQSSVNNMLEQELSAEDFQHEDPVSGLVSQHQSGVSLSTIPSELEHTDGVHEILVLGSPPADSESVIRAKRVAFERWQVEENLGPFRLPPGADISLWSKALDAYGAGSISQEEYEVRAVGALRLPCSTKCVGQVSGFNAGRFAVGMPRPRCASPVSLRLLKRTVAEPDVSSGRNQRQLRRDRAAVGRRRYLCGRQARKQACEAALQRSKMRRKETRKHREQLCRTALKLEQIWLCLSFFCVLFGFDQPRKSFARRLSRRRRARRVTHCERVPQSITSRCYADPENSASRCTTAPRVSLCMSELKMCVLPVVAPSHTWKRHPGCCKCVSRRRLTVSRRHNRVLGEDRLRRARDACKHGRVVRLLRRRTREHLDELKKLFRGAEGKRMRFQDEREIMSTSTTARTSSVGEDRITDLEKFVPAAEHVDERAVPRKCSSKNFQGRDESMASSSMGVPAVPEVKEVRAPRRHRRVRFASAHSCCGPGATFKSSSVAGLDQSNSQACRTFTVEVLGLSGRLGCLARTIGVSGHVRQILLIACRSLHCLPRQLKIVLGAREIDACDDSLIDMAASEAMQRTREGVVHVSVFRHSRLTACCTHRVWCSWKEFVLMPPLCGDSSDSGDGAMPADAEATYLSSSDDDRCSSSSSDFCLSSCRDSAPEFCYRDRAAACTVSTSGVQRQPGGSFSLFPR